MINHVGWYLVVDLIQPTVCKVLHTCTINSSTIVYTLILWTTPACTAHVEIL